MVASDRSLVYLSPRFIFKNKISVTPLAAQKNTHGYVNEFRIIGWLRIEAFINRTPGSILAFLQWGGGKNRPNNVSKSLLLCFACLFFTVQQP